jgi:MFS family permease
MPPFWSHSCQLVAYRMFNFSLTMHQVISDSLHGSATSTFWIGTAYLLPCAVFQPFIVALSDIFGRKQALFVSITLFTVGTIACCTSHTITQLLAGRSVQGIGGAGITALPNVIYTDFVPLRQRPKYTAFAQLAWALGTVIGPIIGGLFADHSTWRWAFYIQLPFCAIGMAMIPLVVKLQAERPSVMERLLQVDWIGGILFIGSSLAFLIGLTSGGIEHPWQSWHTLLPIEIGVVGIIITLIWEHRVASKPFLRLAVFNSTSACAAYMTTILQGVIVRSCPLIISHIF